jgi:hypothetical protein
MMNSQMYEVTTGSGETSRRAFVVIGMHRSGTSAMTRMLSLLGASLPRGLMPPVKENNESGFWEATNVANLNDEILQALDSEWDDVFAFRPRQYLSNFDRFYFGRAIDVVEQEFNGAEVIVLKDPRVSVLTAFWERVLREAGYKTNYVIMVRNPLEVAESLRERDGFPREKSLLLWSSYMLAAERDTRDAKRIFVSYSDLVNDWRSVRTRVEDVIGVPFPRDTAAAGVEIDRFLDRHLCHHRASSQALFSRAEVPEAIKDLYPIFADACEGKTVDHAALDAIRSELSKMDVLVGPLFADLRGRLRGITRDLEELSNAHAGACERADSLQEQLAAERSLRELEAQRAAESNTEYVARIAELTERITTTENERNRLAGGAEDNARVTAELAASLAAAEAERIRLSERLAATNDRLAGQEVELTTTRELVSKIRAEMAAKEEKLIQHLEETSTLKNLLTKSEQESELARRDAQEAREAARAKEDKLSRQIERAEGEAREVRETLKTNERKLTQRTHEITTLTKLLRRQEERGEEADQQVRWLLALNERLAKQPRWWTLLPKSWRGRRRLDRLRGEGLFDGEAYLQRYPDVAEARRDPLDHYLEYGYIEGRRREP